MARPPPPELCLRINPPQPGKACSPCQLRRTDKDNLAGPHLHRCDVTHEQRLDIRTYKRDHDDKWWVKQPTIAGEWCTPAQRRLSDSSSFTGVHRRKLQAGCEAMMHTASGEYCERPIRAQRMLQSRSYCDLTQPTRAADFRSETEWRLGLRPSPPRTMNGWHSSPSLHQTASLRGSLRIAQSGGLSKGRTLAPPQV
mmetsp:Transcript_59916/g.118828  ORF Transcript_59916/g.118828 Transcript_59916/m.118828 type:complete len:197 (+) Transcript_59916:67-657(+)